MKLRISALILTVFAMFGAGLAQAAPLDPLGPYSQSGTCSTGDVTGGALDCFGGVTAKSNSKKVDVNNAIFGKTQGLFGQRSWTDIYSGSANVKALNGRGAFLSAWNLKGPVAIMLRHGKRWSAYLFDGLSQGIYRFDISATSTSNIKNLRVLNTSPVPVPAALPMLAVALGGLFAFRRRSG